MFFAIKVVVLASVLLCGSFFFSAKLPLEEGVDLFKKGGLASVEEIIEGSLWLGKR